VNVIAKLNLKGEPNGTTQYARALRPLSNERGARALEERLAQAAAAKQSAAASAV